MAIVKRFEELTQADKIYLLHSLFPQDIKALLIFIAARIPWVLQKPEARIFVECPTDLGPNWYDVLESLSLHIELNFDTLLDQKSQFVETFSKGKNQYFFMDCLIAYIDKSNNHAFRKCLEFLFDL